MRTGAVDKYRHEKIIDLDLGQMELIFDLALVTRSSDKILFFKQEWNYEFEDYRWINYYTINKVRGFLYYIKHTFFVTFYIMF